MASPTSLAVKSLPLLQKTIDLETALKDDDNVLQQLTYPSLRDDFLLYLISQKFNIEAIVASHLGLCKSNSCQVAEKGWLYGSFNVCIPVNITNTHTEKRVIFRVPLPYKTGDTNYPGNSEEKHRCEVATYVWMQQHCPAVPIPKLLGFGFANGQSFSPPQAVSFFHRTIWHTWRFLSSFFGKPLPCAYISQIYSQKFNHGYSILEYIEKADAKMLSDTWRSLRHNSSLRANLFRDISRITLSLARHTFPHIGSLRMDDRGFVRLSNRPLTLRLQHLENEGIPTQISRGQLYFTSDAYILDLLACYDSKLRHQPNSMLDFVDGCSQMAAVTALRATHSHYLQRDFRYGPFIFMLTDLHQSNIFVDENWNVKYIIDLEWTCTQPIEMLRAPYWLTDRSVDNLLPEDGLEEFTKMHAEFLESFEKEEKKMQDRDPNFNIPLFGRQFTDIMRSCWENGSFWFFYALENPKGLFSLFYYHLLPRYGPTDPNFYNVFCSYWAVDAAELVGKKLKDKEDYDIKLREAFQKESEGSQR